MKKLFLFLSIICLLTGCSKGGSENSQVSDNQTEQATPSNENQTENNNSGDTGNKVDELNELYNSAIMQGVVADYSDSQIILGGDLFADADSSDSPFQGGNVVVKYSDGTEFQKGVFKSDGSDYSLEASDRSSLTEDASILIYGSKLDGKSYSADKIIVVEYDYN